jgi:hypothetical protein
LYKYIHVKRTDDPSRIRSCPTGQETVGFAVTQIQIVVEPTRQEEVFLAEFLQQVVAVDSFSLVLQLPFAGQQKLEFACALKKKFPLPFPVRKC